MPRPAATRHRRTHCETTRYTVQLSPKAREALDHLQVTASTQPFSLTTTVYRALHRDAIALGWRGPRPRPARTRDCRHTPVRTPRPRYPTSFRFTQQAAKTLSFLRLRCPEYNLNGRVNQLLLAIARRRGWTCAETNPTTAPRESPHARATRP